MLIRVTTASCLHVSGLCAELCNTETPPGASALVHVTSNPTRREANAQRHLKFVHGFILKSCVFIFLSLLVGFETVERLKLSNQTANEHNSQKFELLPEVLDTSRYVHVTLLCRTPSAQTENVTLRCRHIGSTLFLFFYHCLMNVFFCQIGTTSAALQFHFQGAQCE